MELRQQRVLVVDDQQAIRTLLRRMLARLDYAILDAEDGPTGIELSKNSDLLSLAIIDLTMPTMDGITLTNELRALQPRLPIVLMSGFDMDDVMSSRPEIDPAPVYLEKPFRFDDLVGAINAAMKPNS